jgi:hypothetical protein
MARIKNPRTCLSGQQRAQLWRIWQAKEPQKQIAAALQRPYGTVHLHIYRRGGFPPAPRRRHARVLSFSKREEISRGLCAHGRPNRWLRCVVAMM